MKRNGETPRNNSKLTKNYKLFSYNSTMEQNLNLHVADMNDTEHFLAATYRSYWPTPPWSMLSLN